MTNLLSITLTVIAALESNDGKDVAHTPIRRLASIHHGDAAIGRFGMMPKTLLELREPDADRAAHKLARRILARTRCPYLTAVILWERGPRHKVTTNSWLRGNAPKRFKRAKRVWHGPVQRTKHAGTTFQ